MRERFVCFRHSVSIFLLLDGAARVIVRVHKFGRQFVRHFSFRSLSRIDHEPADRKSLTSFGADFHGLMSFVTTLLPYIGSGKTSLLGTLPLLGMI